MVTTGGFLQRWFAFWEQPSEERLDSILAPDVELRLADLPTPIRGIDEARAQLGYVLAVGPDVRFTPTTHALNGDVAFLSWIGTCTVRGASVEVEGICRVRLGDDGRVREGLTLIDPGPWHRADMTG